MYQPKFPPLNTDVKGLAQYVGDELQAVARDQGGAVDFVQLNVLKRAPTKPVDGIVVCADGTNWAPLGAGGGFFGYYGGAWVKLNN
jgi:hypothetical protein